MQKSEELWLEDVVACGFLIGVVFGWRSISEEDFPMNIDEMKVSGNSDVAARGAAGRKPAKVGMMADRPQRKGRDSLRDQCVEIYAILSRKTPNRIRISEMANIFGINNRTVRRWVDSFSKVMNVRIEKGFVVIGEG
jgi:hypothetical protein